MKPTCQTPPDVWKREVFSVLYGFLKLQNQVLQVSTFVNFLRFLHAQQNSTANTVDLREEITMPKM